MAIHNPKQTLENRYKIEQELIEEVSASPEDLAVYFGTTPTVIRKDLRNLHIEAGGGNESEIESLRIKRDIEFSKRIRNGEKKEIVLTDYGLWRQPRNFNDINILSEIAPRILLPKSERGYLLSLIELGWSVEDAIKRCGGLDSISRTVLTGYLRKNSLTPKHIKENDKEMNDIVSLSLKEAYQKSLENEESYRSFRKGYFKTILDLTGASEIRMYEMIGKKDFSEQKQKILSDRKLNNVKQKIEIKNKKELAFEEWISGRATQQQLADRFNVTRQTIMNWIRSVYYEKGPNSDICVNNKTITLLDYLLKKEYSDLDFDYKIKLEKDNKKIVVEDADII